MEKIERRKIPDCSKRNVPFIAFVNSDKRVVKISKPRCWCWDCEGCSEARKDYWSKRVYSGLYERMEKGEVWYFVTFTSHENCKTYSQTAYILKHNFPKLYKRMLRQYDGLMYISVPEPHQDQRLHVHMITNAPLRKKWYKDNARECGFGYQADAKRIENANVCASYVVKYLSKSLSSTVLLKKRFQRVRASKHFPDIDDDASFDRQPSEVVGNEEQARLFIAGYRHAGWIVMGYETGELL